MITRACDSRGRIYVCLRAGRPNRSRVGTRCAAFVIAIALLTSRSYLHNPLVVQPNAWNVSHQADRV